MAPPSPTDPGPIDPGGAATGRLGLTVAASLVAGIAGAALVWSALGWWARPPAPTAIRGPIPSAAPTRDEAVVADEAAILAAHAPSLLVFRLRQAPHVLVLSFPTLHDQALMLNRLGAFVEKSGLPRDRVLSDAELDAAIVAAGDTDATFYYGHDYRAADMARFFAIATRDGVRLRPAELELRGMLDREGLLTAGAIGAVISVPPQSAEPPIDAASRATILHHEVSHGIYFTDPAYSAYAGQFWNGKLDENRRAAFRRFLAGQGYDTANEDLMLNEAQAYLVHTPDSRYFEPALVGLTAVAAAALRATFLAKMPDPWLADARP